MKTFKKIICTKILLSLLVLELNSFIVEAQSTVTLPAICNTCGTAVITSITNCSAATTGVLSAGTPVSGVTQTIAVTVGTAGTYNISATANGVTFSGAGFLAVGNQTIVLTATGTPTTAGTSSFTLNTTPTCTFTRTVNPAVNPLPANIVLSKVSPLFIASVNDQNYIPYTTPTAPATLATGVAADGTAEVTLIDVQGVIPTTGLTVLIPYAASGSVSLPAYSQTINIPAAYTQDGVSRNITLSWPAGSYTAGTGNITATVSAVGGALNVKKLDMQTGIGNDGLGWLLGQFTYPLNSSGGIAPLEVRDIAGIPDRNFTDPNHRFLYIPMVTATGKVWLNNNLGADYSNTANPAFNPAAQATSFNDVHAFGSLFQWGRYSDGHELIDWNDPDAYYPAGGKTAALTQTGTRSSTDTPGNDLFISSTQANWRITDNNSLWQGVSGINNVCPVGWRVPTISELVAEATANGVTSTENAWRLGLKIPASGSRAQNQSSPISIWNQGVYTYLWSSTVGSVAGQARIWQIIGPRVGGDPSTYVNYATALDKEGPRATGLPVRCVMN